MELDPLSGDIAPRTHYLSLQNYVLSSMCSALLKDVEKGESKPKKIIKKDKLSPFVEEHLETCGYTEMLTPSCLEYYSNPPLELPAQSLSLDTTWAQLQHIESQNKSEFSLFFPNVNPVCEPISSHTLWNGLEQLIKPFQISYNHDVDHSTQVPQLSETRQVAQPAQPVLTVANPAQKRVKPTGKVPIRCKARKMCVRTHEELSHRRRLHHITPTLSSSRQRENSLHTPSNICPIGDAAH